MLFFRTLPVRVDSSGLSGCPGSDYYQVSIRHEFDLFVLGYGQLSLDPDYLRNFFHSTQDRARGWNMSGYRNPEFDRVAEESSRTMDPEKRIDMENAGHHHE